MGCCDCCMRTLLGIVNITTIILGIACATAGMVFIFKGSDYLPDIDQYSHVLYSPCGILIGIGAVLILFGCYGTYSTFTLRSSYLNVLFYALLLLSLTEIGTLIFGVIKKESLTDSLLEDIDVWFSNVNDGNATELQRLGVTSIQLTLDCCGLEEGPDYWTLWNMEQKIPASCCGHRASPYSAAYYCDKWDPDAAERSCLPILQTLIKTHLVWGVIGLLGGFILLNGFLMFSSKWLRKYRYEDEDYGYERYTEHDTASSFTGKTASSGFNSTWL